MNKKHYKKPISKVAPFELKGLLLNNGSNTGNTESLTQGYSLGDDEYEYEYETDNF